MRVTRKKSARDQGFTLVELIVVVTVLALLMAMLAPKLTGVGTRAKVQIAQMQVTKVKGKLELAALDIGRYPTADEGLLALTERRLIAENWNGPYLEKDQLSDPWRHPLQYRRPCQHGGLHEYDLFSFGPNGQEDPGEGGDDIRSWQ